jgi:DNA-binding CsgD family transcriptional regulator
MMLLGRRAECEVLDAALADAIAGRSRVVVLRGEAGAGKSALLDYVSEQAADWRIVTAVAIESEMELAYGGLHQLCAPLLDRLDRLPVPQRDALGTVFGLTTGPAPDRFLVGLATLTLLADAAEAQPLLCLLDDAHWLDETSAQILGFVARRLLAERIAVVSAARTGVGDEVFAGLPALPIDGLGASEARALLLDNLRGPFDAAVCDQIITESHGNPLALLELPRTWNAADLAGGFGLPARMPVAGKIEQSYATRLQSLPAATQLLVLAAAAEPLGDRLLLNRALESLGVSLTAAGPAVDAGLLEVDARVGFTHPLVRAAAYRSAVADDRHRVHRALADATDPTKDPDRRAWHRARGTAGPDEDIAGELERSAARAQARGGIAAAAAFLERAAALSSEAGSRALRALRAAEAKQLAGAAEDASTLLATAASGPLDEVERAKAQRLEGQIALDLRRGADAVPFLLDAAKRLEAVEPALARETYLEALRAASISGRFGSQMLLHAAEAARKAPPPEGTPRAIDLLLEGLSVRFSDGYVASVPALKRGLSATLDQGRRTDQDPRWPWFARRVAPELFDDEGWNELATRSVQIGRDRGALGILPLALNFLATCRCFEGELDAADAALEEADVISDATGIARIVFGRLLLAGLRGDDAALSGLVETGKFVAIDRSEGVVTTYSEHARALLYNGLGRYEAALAPAESAVSRDELCLSVWALPELVEAAARSGKADLAARTLDQLAERAQAAGTEWALGILARSRALLSEGLPAEELYREAVDRLGRSRLAPDRARAHLLYGEWLRREGRRVVAREHLRKAHEMLEAIGMEAFAERARRELLATGERARKRSADTRWGLTLQEAQIAKLASDGHSNSDIAAQLFLSTRTIEWHLRKVFTKLGISSRKELGAALRTGTEQLQPA